MIKSDLLLSTCYPGYMQQKDTKREQSEDNPAGRWAYLNGKNPISTWMRSTKRIPRQSPILLRARNWLAGEFSCKPSWQSSQYVNGLHVIDVKTKTDVSLFLELINSHEYIWTSLLCWIEYREILHCNFIVMLYLE